MSVRLGDVFIWYNRHYSMYKKNCGTVTAWTINLTVNLVSKSIANDNPNPQREEITTCTVNYCLYVLITIACKSI